MRLFLDNAAWITLDEANSQLPPENIGETGQINASFVFQSETDYLYYTTHATDGIGGYSDGEGLTGGITTAYDDDGTYSIGVNLDEDQGWGMQTVWEGSWNVNVYDVPPGATMNSQLLEDHETVRVMLTSPFDVSNADTAAGFHVSLSPTYSGLAQTYSSADPWPTEGDPFADFNFESSPSGTFYARIFDWNGGYSDYATTYVLPTVNTPIITDTSVQLCWLDVAEGESSWIVQRALYGGSFSTVATLDLDSTSWLDTNLTPGTRYQWRIRAAGEEGAAGDTAWSAKRAVTTIARPTNLTVSLDGGGQLDLTWDDNGSWETGHRVEVSTDGVDFTTASLLNENASYDFQSFEGLRYFRVIATRGDLTSEPSNTAVVFPIPGTTQNDTITVRQDPFDSQAIDYRYGLGNWAGPYSMPSGSTLVITGGAGDDTIILESLPATTTGGVNVFGYQVTAPDGQGLWTGAFDDDVLDIAGTVGHLAAFPPKISFDGGDPIQKTFPEDPQDVPVHQPGGHDAVIIHSQNDVLAGVWSVNDHEVKRDTSLSVANVCNNIPVGWDGYDDSKTVPFPMSLYLGSGADSITAGSDDPMNPQSGGQGYMLDLGGGDDLLVAEDLFASTIDGGAGNDTFRLQGGAYNDGFIVGGLDVRGGAGDDLIEVGGNDQTVFRVSGNVVSGGSGNDLVRIDDRSYDSHYGYGTTGSHYVLVDSNFSIGSTTILSYSYNNSAIERFDIYMQEQNWHPASANIFPTLDVTSTPIGTAVYVTANGLADAEQHPTWLENIDTITVRETANNLEGGNPTDVVHVNAQTSAVLFLNVGDGAGIPATVVIEADPQATPYEFFIHSLAIFEDGTVSLRSNQYHIGSIGTLSIYDNPDDNRTGTFDMSDVQNVEIGDVVRYAVTYPEPSQTRVATQDITGRDALVYFLRLGFNSPNSHGRAGDWGGPGITSFACKADGVDSTGIGYSYNSALNAFELYYTWLGDADLDFDVDNADLGVLSTQWNLGYHSDTGTWDDRDWVLADFTYDNFDPNYRDVDSNDLYVLYANYGKTSGNLQTLRAGHTSLW
jgi:hypothetical protein